MPSSPTCPRSLSATGRHGPASWAAASAAAAKFQICRLEPDDKGGYVATFPDLPFGATQGNTMADALKKEADLLLWSRLN